MGTFRVGIEIGNPEGTRYERVEALVDTGATYTALPASLLRRLGVVPHDRATFRLADGRRQMLEIGRTWVRLEGRQEIVLVVFGAEEATSLLGAFTLEAFRLAPDPIAQRLVPVEALLLQRRDPSRIEALESRKDADGSSQSLPP